MYRIFELARVALEGLVLKADIGGTDIYGGAANKGWIDASKASDIMWLVVLGPGTGEWADAVTTLKIERAMAADGTGRSDVSTSGEGGDYDPTVEALDSAGDMAVVYLRNFNQIGDKYRYVRLYVAAEEDTDADLVSVIPLVIPRDARHDRLYGKEKDGLLYVYPGRRS